MIKLESNPLERNTFKFIINLKFRITTIFQERKSSRFETRMDGGNRARVIIASIIEGQSFS